jgi:YaiO family outer membrane protein
VRLEVQYTDFSKLLGDKVVATAESRFGIAKETQYSFSVSGGRRTAAGRTINAALVSGSVDHDWTDRLSTRTSLSLASNGAIFAKRQALTDISYRLSGGLVATVGGKYADYGRGNAVATWSGGAAYSFSGASLSYRFSLIDSRLLGRSSSHLASVRLKDAGGRGATQLWLGRGTSLFDVISSPTAARGRFSSIALRRQQPLGGGAELSLGLNRTWYDTPNASYHGTGLNIGFSLIGN